MRKLLLLFLVLLLPAALLAQEKMSPPKYLQIIREDVKVGRGAAHDKWESSWTQAMVRAKFTTPMLAMNAVSGPSEALFISGYDSLGAYEADMKLLETPAMAAVMAQYGPGDAEYVSGGRTQIAVFREDLSYNSTNIKLGEMRYFQVRTVRVRPGHDGEYAELRKFINAARQKTNSPAHSVVFQVIAGAPNGTYLVFNPLKSLADADPVGSPAIMEALGSDGQAKLNDLANKSIVFSEDAIYQFSPKMSNPSAQTVAEDPGFWKPKPASATTATKTPAPGAKKEVKK